MNPSYFQQTVDSTLQFVGLASKLCKRACDEVRVHRSMQKKAADQAPVLLDLMVSTGAIPTEHKEAVAAMLGDHAGTMTLLKNAVDQLADARRKEGLKKATDLGRGEDDPSAAPEFDSLNGPFVGRKTSQKSASDMAILKVLEPPTR